MRDYTNIEEVPSIELTDEELATVSGGAIHLKFGDTEGNAASKGDEKWIERLPPGL